jgi:hypothetical protein
MKFLPSYSFAGFQGQSHEKVYEINTYDVSFSLKLGSLTVFAILKSPF